MKALFWIGLAVLAAGIVALAVPMPRVETDSLEVAGVSVGVETRHRDTISPVIGAVMILSGAGLMIAAKVSAK
jgi:hypothetical protein